MLKLLFCSDTFNPHAPDPVYAGEVEAATPQGFECWLLDSEALFIEQDFRRAVRQVPAQPAPCVALYRGWMLTPAGYTRLYEALARKNVFLINDPAAYRFCHYLPEFYETIRQVTPRSVWLPLAAGTPDLLPLDAIMGLLVPFGSGPLVLKDFVKSRKHEWLEACFIPDASDRAAVARVVKRFLELQGADLNEGLVFREFVEFEPVGVHPQSGLPLTNEHRLFFLDGRLLFQTDYWAEADYTAAQAHPVPLDFLGDIAKRVKSRFFTLDAARTVAGDWLVIELGDGQVSGLPDNADLAAFYRSLAKAAPEVVL